MEQLRPNPEQEIKELKDIVERHEKFETYVLFENKQLKDSNDILEAHIRLHENDKQKLEKIKELIPMLIKQLKSGEADNEGMCVEYGGDPEPRATQYKTSIKELKEILESKE